MNQFWSKLFLGFPNNNKLMSGQLKRGGVPSEDLARIIQEPSRKSRDAPYKVLWLVCISGADCR